MAQNRPYIYDPSQQIRKDLGSAADSVAQGFQNVLDKKKQDYALVKNQFDNIEALKKDLNIYDNEVITKRVNELLGKTSGMIKEKGKVDFSSLGEVRQEIRAISDAKRNSALKSKALEEATVYTLKNAANMTDIQGTINEMKGILRNPDALFSPNSIDNEIMRIYKKGLNMSKIINDKIDDYLESRAGSNVVSYKNERGDVIEAQYKDIPGLVPSKGGYQVAEIEDKQNPGVKLNPLKGIIRQIISPEELALFAEQSGEANAFEGDPEKLLEPILLSRFNSSVKSKVGVFAEDVARKESLTNATIQKTKDGIENLRLKVENLELRKRQVTTQEGRLALEREYAGLKREGLGYDNELKNLKVNDPETYNRLYGKTDALAAIFGNVASTEAVNSQSPVQQKKANVAEPVKTNSSSVTSRTGKTMSKEAFFKMGPVQRLQWKNN
jgi:hypothetical protein